MKFVFTLLLVMASGSAFAGSAFETVDITKLRVDRERSVQNRRDDQFSRLYNYNMKLIGSIPAFAQEHGGLASEPTCNSQNWRCAENGACFPNAPAPWNPYQPLRELNLRSFIQVQNCNVAVNDGWTCVLNWFGPEGGTHRITFHCNREGYQKDFIVKGSKGAP